MVVWIWAICQNCEFQSNGAPVPEERCAHSDATGVKRRQSVLSGQRPQFLTELRPLAS